MAIEGFDVKEQWIGTSDTDVYTFDFLITNPSQVHIYIQDQFGNIINDTDGADTAVFSGVTFDAVDGGGTFTLVENLPNNYVLTALLANNSPDQPTSFPNARSFTFEIVEAMIDYMAAWGQRAAWLAQRSLRLHDLDDIDNFDVRLPQNLSTFPGQVMIVREDGAAIGLGPTVAEIIQSALVSSGGGYFIIPGNRRTAPIIVAITISPSNIAPRELQFVVGVGPNTVASMTGGSVLGQELLIMGTDNTNTIALTSSANLDLDGSCVLGNSDMISLIWDGSSWVEMWRRQES